MTRRTYGWLVLVFLLAAGPVAAQQFVGAGVFSLKKTDVVATAGSTNVVFYDARGQAFTSKKIAIETPSGNTQDICISWGATAATCPTVNQAGFDRIRPGTALILDNIALDSINIIAVAGEQTILIRAWY